MKKKFKSNIDEKNIDAALLVVKKSFMAKIEQGKSSKNSYSSVCEALGKITEEYHELISAIHSKDENDFRNEAIDLAMASIRILFPK